MSQRNTCVTFKELLNSLELFVSIYCLWSVFTVELVQMFYFSFEKLHLDPIKIICHCLFRQTCWTVRCVCHRLISDRALRPVLKYRWVLVHVQNSLLCLHCFFLAKFNVIISPVMSLVLRTHPAGNNTPLSSRGTETETSEFTVRTLQHGSICTLCLSLSPSILFFFKPGESNAGDWSHPGCAGAADAIETHSLCPCFDLNAHNHRMWLVFVR